jgi:hypothetical protein
VLASDCSVGAVSAVGAMVVVGDPAGAAVVVAQPANAAVANNPAIQLFVIASTLTRILQRFCVALLPPLRPFRKKNSKMVADWNIRSYHRTVMTTSYLAGACPACSGGHRGEDGI